MLLIRNSQPATVPIRNTYASVPDVYILFYKIRCLLLVVRGGFSNWQRKSAMVVTTTTAIAGKPRVVPSSTNSTTNNGASKQQTAAVAAAAAANGTSTNATNAGDSFWNNYKNSSSSGSGAVLSREEMAVLKTTLAVLVVKERLKIQQCSIKSRFAKPYTNRGSSSSSSSYSSSDSIKRIRHSLGRVTGKRWLEDEEEEQETDKAQVQLLSNKETAPENGENVHPRRHQRRRATTTRLLPVRVASDSGSSNTTTLETEKTKAVLLVAHPDQTHWRLHVQHILQLIWCHCRRQRHYRHNQHPSHPPRVRTNNNNYYNQDDADRDEERKVQALCVHVACQIEQAAPEWKQQQIHNNNNNNDHWLRTLLLADLPSSSVGSPNNQLVVIHNDNNNNNNTTIQMPPQSSQRPQHHEWLRIWTSILRAKPIAVSEFLVPVCLDMLLHLSLSSSSKRANSISNKRLNPAAAVAARANNASNGGDGSGDAGNDAGGGDGASNVVLVLELLERALELAPPHVRLEAIKQLGSPPGAATVEGDSAAAAVTTTEGANRLSLYPMNNSTWYSSQDLAFHYFLEQKQLDLAAATTTRPTTPAGEDNSGCLHLTTVGDAFLLGHGLAALSERLLTSCSSKSCRNESRTERLPNTMYIVEES